MWMAISGVICMAVSGVRPGLAGLYGTGLSLPGAAGASAMRRTDEGRVPAASWRRERQARPRHLEDAVRRVEARVSAHGLSIRAFETNHPKDCFDATD